MPAASRKREPHAAKVGPAAKAAQVPKVAAGPLEVDTVEEIPLEEQITDFEVAIKNFKGAEESTVAKSQIEFGMLRSSC